jgi:hypothetical protein
VRRRRSTPAGPAIDWEKIADGRVWRLRRGLHYEGSDRAVLSSARAAAGRMGMVVSMAREDYGRTAGYVWIQFADAEVAHGDPCPRCGSTTLHSERPGFATCPQCAARLLLLVEDEDPGIVLDGSDGAAPAAAVTADKPELDAAAPATAQRTPRTAATLRVTQQLPQIHFDPQTVSIARLEFYAELRLRAGASPVGQAAFYGFGQARGVKPTLLHVQFFPAEEDGALGDHRVVAIAARPFSAALDFGALSDWAHFVMRPLTPADEGRLTPIHPYYSLNEETGIYVIPVAGAGDAAIPPPSEGSS